MLYADLVGFTSFSAQADPFKVMVFLNDLFQVFDGMCDEYNVYKIETIGDCYVAAVGVVTGELMNMKVAASQSARSKKYMKEQIESTDSISQRISGLSGLSDSSRLSSMRSSFTLNARDLVGFAKAMIRGSREVMKPTLNTPAIMRVGIHTVSFLYLKHRIEILLSSICCWYSY